MRIPSAKSGELKRNTVHKYGKKLQGALRVTAVTRKFNSNKVKQKIR